MARFFVTLVLLGVTAAFAAPARASPAPVLTLTGPVETADLAPFLEYMLDADWQMTVAEISDPATIGWRPVTGSTPDFGYTAARIWLRVAVANRTPDTADWRLFVHANFWPTVQIWRRGTDGRTTSVMDLGPESPFGDRPLVHPQLVAPFVLAPGEVAMLIMAYSSQGSSRNAFSIQTAESFAVLNNGSIAKTYAFYGMFFALFAVTTIALVVLREVLHLIYAGYILSLFLYLAHIDGTAFQFLWPHFPGFNGMASVVTGTGVMVFGVLFAIVYLQTRRYHPVMHVILLAAAGSVLTLVTVLWTYDPQLLKQFMVVMITVNALVILSAAIVAALRRYHEVKYYLLAWSAALIPAALFTARHIFGFEPDFISTYDAVRAALVFDAYMMGFATFDQLRQSRELALAESLAMARRNLALGSRLALLDERYEQLSSQARRREENVMDAVHDLRQPMHALRLSMRQRFANAQQGSDAGQIEAALTYMEQLVADRLAARSGGTDGAPAESPHSTADRAAPGGVTPDEPGLHEVLRGVHEMFAPAAAAKGLGLAMRLGAPDGPVAAYPLMRAMANLVSNAIKYTREGRVLITQRRHGTGWRVEVHDTGPGLGGAQFEAALERSHRLARDRKDTEGSGLGLAIVKEIAEANGWQITSCHHRRKGASIRLDVPFAAGSAVLGR